MDTIIRLHKLVYTGSTLSLLLCLTFCSGKTDPPAEEQPPPPPHALPRLIRTLPHDTTSFTQGLLYENGRLFESTGLYGKSTLQTLDTMGTVTLKRELSAGIFAEGCAFFAGTVFQITWREQLCFTYAAANLTPVDTLSYSGEGWGLTENDTLFIMSNGSDTLFFRNNRFNLVRRLPVTCGGTPLVEINELEYARGRIYANVWHSDFIFEINPGNGRVERIYDCSELVAREAPPSDEHVLNGIAYNPASDQFYLTGKNWKNLFVVTLPRK